MPSPRARAMATPIALASRGAPVLAVLLAAAHALHSGWGRWGNLYVDTGRELEWPRRILEGERLYADLHYFYGPLAPYLNAALYRLFGVQVNVLAAAGAAAGVAAALALHAIAARFVARWAAALAAVAFVYVLGFAHLIPVGIFNFVLPYSFSATYGMLAALLSLAALLAHLKSSRPSSFLASVLFLFLAALSKLEPLVPALAVHLVFAAAAIARRRFERVHAAGYVLAALATIATYGAFYLRVGPALLSDHLGGALNAGSVAYVRASMGLSDLGGNLRAAAGSGALLAAVVVLALGAGALAERLHAAAAKGALLAAAGAGALALTTRAGPDATFRALPLLATLAFGALAWRAAAALRSPEVLTGLLPHLLLAAFTGAAALRVFFAATPEHYGFFMLAPAVVWLAVLLFDHVPRLAPASAWTRRAAGVCGAALLVGISAAAFRESSANAAQSTLPFRSARGTLWMPEGASEVVPFLRLIAGSPPEATLLVLPQGAAINFLAERRGARDGMYQYLPMEVHGGHDAAAIVARWEREPPDLVLWHDWVLSDMGDARFGFTYAVEAGRWLLAHYEPVTDPSQQIVLLRRRARGAAAE